MRLAWFTPFSDRSDIGAHSKCIVEALPDSVKQGSCVFINENTKGKSYRTSLASVRLTNHLDHGIFDLFDNTIFNIGNNQENHYFINHYCLNKAGTVVVHDIVMQHFMAWLLFEEKKSPEKYAELMVHYYGDRALDVLESSRLLQKGRTPRYAPWDSVHSISYPLLEPFLANARAVVVHSEFAEKLVSSMTDRPIIRLFLPSDKKPAPDRNRPATNSMIEFVSIGHIGRAKFLHLVISAFSNSELLRLKSKFSIVGMPGDHQYVTELQQQVAALDLSNNIKFELGVSESKLAEIKSYADVFINIRFPNTESASGSLTEQMACGRPVIVLNSGCYVEIPDDCVLKINSLDDSSELLSIMEKLVTDSTLRSHVGLRASEYIGHRTARVYGQKLLDGLKGTAPSTPKRGRTLPATTGSHAPVAASHWVLDERNGAPTPEVWTGLGPIQCARLMYLVRRDGDPSRSEIDAVAAILRGVDQPLRGNVVVRYLVIRHMLQQDVVIGAHHIDSKFDRYVFALMLCVSRNEFACLLYRFILGRKEFDGEINPYSLRLADLNAVNLIVKEFLASEEFQRRNVSNDFFDILNETILSVSDVVIIQSDSTPTFPDRVRFGLQHQDSHKFLVGQWYEPENDGIWSKGTDAGIRFRAATNAAADDHLVLALRIAGSEFLGQRICRVFVNEVERLQTFLSDDDRVLIRIPLYDIEAEQIVSVRVSLDRSVQLTEFGGSDSRHLGVFLFEAFVERS